MGRPPRAATRPESRAEWLESSRAPRSLRGAGPVREGRAQDAVASAAMVEGQAPGEEAAQPTARPASAAMVEGHAPDEEAAQPAAWPATSGKKRRRRDSAMFVSFDDTPEDGGPRTAPTRPAGRRVARGVSSPFPIGASSPGSPLRGMQSLTPARESAEGGGVSDAVRHDGVVELGKDELLSRLRAAAALYHVRELRAAGTKAPAVSLMHSLLSAMGGEGHLPAAAFKKGGVVKKNLPAEQLYCGWVRFMETGDAFVAKLVAYRARVDQPCRPTWSPDVDACEEVPVSGVGGAAVRERSRSASHGVHTAKATRVDLRSRVLGAARNFSAPGLQAVQEGRALESRYFKKWARPACDCAVPWGSEHVFISLQF